MPFCTKHSGHWNSITALMVVGFILAGCKGAEKTAQETSASENKIPQWEVVRGEEALALKLRAKNPIQVADNQATPILYVGCGSAKIVMLMLPGPVPPSKSAANRVSISFDGNSPSRQDWVESGGNGGETVGSTPSQGLDFVVNMLKSKTLKFDFTPPGGSPQSASFDLLDFKDKFQRETRCDSWRTAGN